MRAGVQQQHTGMTALFFKDDAQIISGADGTQAAQFAAQSVVAERWVEGLIHEKCQRSLYPPLIPHGQPSKGLVEPARRVERHGRALRRWEISDSGEVKGPLSCDAFRDSRLASRISFVSLALKR